MTQIKIFLSIVFFFFLAFPSIGQATDSTGIEESNSYVFRLLPSRKHNIYGVCIGPFGNEVMCNPSHLKKTHGLNIQFLGQGIFIPLNRRAFGYKYSMKTDTSWMVKIKDSVNYKALHNGVLISTFGTMTDISNGIVLSGISSLGYKMNGLAINLFGAKYLEVRGLSVAINNQSYDVKGVQIGLINRTNKLRGFQFGLWNVNGKRSLPIINWRFKN